MELQLKQYDIAERQMKFEQEAAYESRRINIVNEMLRH
ncbi:hypothetical protein ECDEC8E_5669 [Escherichia coli DEC8E]|nr:hypothetical protein ECDEC8E_5669 [Escherichia coli DEC8E]